MPSHLYQFLLSLDVSLFVSAYLGLPKLPIGAWNLAASLMSMPKATVHKDASTVLPQYKVWVSWQSLMIQPIPKTPIPQPLTP